MKRPKDHFRTGKFEGLVKEKWQKLSHTKKPDIDNLIKYISDVMNKGFYVDDSQVVKLQAEKVYGRKGKTEIIIEEL